MVGLGCLMSFLREKEPENSGDRGYRVVDVLNVLSGINVEAAARVFRNCMSLWNIRAVKWVICSRREPTVVRVKLPAFLLELKINFLIYSLLWLHCLPVRW